MTIHQLASYDNMEPQRKTSLVREDNFGRKSPKLEQSEEEKLVQLASGPKPTSPKLLSNGNRVLLDLDNDETASDSDGIRSIMMNNDKLVEQLERSIASVMGAGVGLSSKQLSSSTLDDDDEPANVQATTDQQIESSSIATEIDDLDRLIERSIEDYAFFSNFQLVTKPELGPASYTLEPHSSEANETSSTTEADRGDSSAARRQAAKVSGSIDRAEFDNEINGQISTVATRNPSPTRLTSLNWVKVGSKTRGIETEESSTSDKHVNGLRILKRSRMTDRKHKSRIDPSSNESSLPSEFNNDKSWGHRKAFVGARERSRSGPRYELESDVSILPSCQRHELVDEDQISLPSPFPLYKSCDELPECESGGKCIENRINGLNEESINSSSEDRWIRIARCRCPIGRAGLLCQRRKCNSRSRSRTLT